ncbi:MAG: hypothetical protein JNM21_12370 [Taibaiella sp.]|nr:hypothetical protein [Taibaiella sp.]
MNKLSVLLNQEENLILEAGYCHIKWNASIKKSEIKITDIISIKNISLLTSGNHITIEVKYNGIQFEYVYLKIDKFNYSIANKEILITSDFNPRSINYSQNEIDILYKEETDDDWSNLDLEKKETMIRSFMIKNGLPKYINPSINISIDCNKIIDYIDIYYFLSRALLGEQKYLGVGLDSFEDCLIEIQWEPQHKIEIHFLNSNKIENKEIKLELQDAIDILKKYGVKVVEEGSVT